MISQLNNFYFPYSYEKGSSFCYSRCLMVFTSMRIRCSRMSESGHCPKVSVIEPASEVPIQLSVNKISRAVRSDIKISKAVRSDAQAALLDYLHRIRGFSFVDAEHISKNSPCFLKDLLSKIKIGKDVKRALLQFLRRHPINEFEPFFESLGLNPKEISSLLPQKLMFLSEDHILLDNYHVLSDYGIPSSKIGKMYKEATEIFRYGNGVLSMKLRAYEQLGLCQSTVVNLVSCCPTLLIGCTNNDFRVVLEKLKELGFESDWIGSWFSSKNTYRWSRILDTMCFLNDLGCTDAEMAAMFKENPSLLFEWKHTYLLVGQLVKLGLSKNAICAVFLEHPKILTSTYAKRLWEAIRFLFEIGMDTENIGKIVSTHVELIGLHPLIRPSTVLRKLKFDRHCLCQSIQEDPMVLFRLASNLTSYLEKKTFLLSLGFVEDSDELTEALTLVQGKVDQLKNRFDCLVEAGLDRNDAMNMIRHTPYILNHTKEKIRKKIDSLGKYLGYPVESLVRFPAYFTYSRERINSRFAMYAWARSMGVVKPMISISTIVACSEELFLKYFVDIHPEGPAMWESLKKSFYSN